MDCTANELSPRMSSAQKALIRNLMRVLEVRDIEGQFRNCRVKFVVCCFKDSGGPLVIKEGGVPIQVGVVSFVSSRGCTIGELCGFVAQIITF